MAKRIFSVLLSFVVGGLTACGPTVKIHPMFTERSADVVSLLPSEVPDGVQRERVAYFRDLLRLELENDGFILLDDAIVRMVCSRPVCAKPEQHTLAEKYGVKGFFHLEIESTRRVNFLAGYYNAVSGNLTFHDSGGEELVRVEHTESTKGGLVFESGQVIQGIINQVRNSQGDAVNAVGAKFVRTMVNEIPDRMKSRKLNKVIEVQIAAVETNELKPSVSKVCVQGTKNGIAVLVLDGRKATLRQTKPGTYCGIFRTRNGLNKASGASVELRSPYGTAVRRALNGKDMAVRPSFGPVSMRATSYGRQIDR